MKGTKYEQKFFKGHEQSYLIYSLEKERMVFRYLLIPTKTPLEKIEQVGSDMYSAIKSVEKSKKSNAERI